MEYDLIKIAECDGGVEVVERKLYNVIQEEVGLTLANHGPAAVLALVERDRLAKISEVRAAILLTMVERLPEGNVRLRSADEVDYYRK